MECYVDDTRLYMFNKYWSVSLPFKKVGWCNIWVACNHLRWDDGLRLIWRKLV